MSGSDIDKPEENADDYTFSDFSDDSALLARDDNDDMDTGDKEYEALIMEDDLTDTELEKQLAGLPLPESSLDPPKPEKAEDIGASPSTASPAKSADDGDSGRATAHKSITSSHPSDNSDARDIVVSKTTIKAWDTNASSGQDDQGRQEGKDAKEGEEEEEAKKASNDVIVLEIDGKLQLVHSDDIRAQDGIGLASAATDAGSGSDRQLSPSPATDRRGSKSPTGLSQASSGSATDSRGGDDRSPEKRREAWGGPAVTPKTKVGPGRTPSARSSASTRPLQAGHTVASKIPASRSRPSGGGDSGAFNAWVASKSKARASTKKASGQLSISELDRRKREEGDAAWQAWRSAKQDDKRKERARRQEEEERRKREENMAAQRRELSSDAYIVWLREKRQQIQFETERKRLSDEFEQSKKTTVTTEECKDAYKQWLRNKAREDQERKEWMAYRRREQVLEARRIKKSLQARYTQN